MLANSHRLEYNIQQRREGCAVKMCILEENKICDDCGQCNMCDLDPTKICDNCMKCIHTGAEYNAVEIDEIIVDDSDDSNP